MTVTQSNYHNYFYCYRANKNVTLLLNAERILQRLNVLHFNDVFKNHSDFRYMRYLEYSLLTTTKTSTSNLPQLADNVQNKLVLMKM